MPTRKEGAKALAHCGPPTCTRTETVKEDGTEQDAQFTFVHFTCKAHWFLLAQREGAELKPAAMRAARIAPARCTHAAHKSRLVSLQAQENRTPATARALINANQ